MWILNNRSIVPEFGLLFNVEFQVDATKLGSHGITQNQVQSISAIQVEVDIWLLHFVFEISQAVFALRDGAFAGCLCFLEIGGALFRIGLASIGQQFAYVIEMTAAKVLHTGELNPNDRHLFA